MERGLGFEVLVTSGADGSMGRGWAVGAADRGHVVGDVRAGVGVPQSFQRWVQRVTGSHKVGFGFVCFFVGK